MTAVICGINFFNTSMIPVLRLVANIIVFELYGLLFNPFTPNATKILFIPASDISHIFPITLDLYPLKS